MTNINYLNDAKKVSDALQSGGANYFKGDSLGDTVVLGTGIYENKSAIGKGVMGQLTRPGDDRTLGSLVGLNPAILSLHYGSQIPEPERPMPLEKKPAIPYLV